MRFVALLSPTDRPQLSSQEENLYIPPAVIAILADCIDPKWQETVLGIARVEQGKEFAVKGMQEEAAVTTDPAAIGGEMGLDMLEREGHGGGGPRRRRPEPAEKHE